MKRIRNSHLLYAIALLMLILICLLPSCASNDIEYQQPSKEIPEGWKVVSENDGVTYLQMKEDSEAYRWTEVSLYAGETEEDHFITEIELPGNPDLKPIDISDSDYLDVIVYYGLFHTEKDVPNNRISFGEISVADAKRYSVELHDDDEDETSLHICDLFNLNTRNTIYVENDSLDDNSPAVGLTQAVMFSIPIAELEIGWTAFELDIRSEDNLIGSRVDLSYCQVYDTMVFEYDHKNVDAIRERFPYVILERFPMINCFLAMIAILLTVVCAIKRWNRFWTWIPCIAGIIFSGIAIEYYDKLPRGDDMFGGLDYIGAYALLWISINTFAVLAVVLAISRSVVEVIRRFRQAKKAAIDADFASDLTAEREKSVIKRIRRPLLVCIAVALLMLILIWCRSCLRTPVELPNGWEVVSEKNDVTFIQMKEGKNAYHWAEFELTADDVSQKQAFLSLQVAKNSDFIELDYDEDAYVNVLLYYGYCKVNAEDDHYELISPDSFADENAYYIEKDDGLTDILCTLPGLADENSVKLNDAGDEVKVGFTQAVMFRIPMSELIQDGSIYYRMRPQVNEYDACTAEFAYDRTVYTMRVANSFEAVDDVDELKFPVILYTRWYTINFAWMVISVLLMIVGAIFKWKRYTSIIPCGVGVLYMIGVSVYSKTLVTGLFDLGALVFAVSATLIYPIFALALFVIRVIIDAIRKRWQNRKKVKEVGVDTDFGTE